MLSALAQQITIKRETPRKLYDSFPVEQKTDQMMIVKDEDLCSAKANEINEKKLELKDLPSHLDLGAYTPYLLDGYGVLNVRSIEDMIRRTDYMDTTYSVEQKTDQMIIVKNEDLCSAKANEINEKKLELKDLTSHLEYAYESLPIMLSSKISSKEKECLLRVLEKYKGEITWKMPDIKGRSPSFYTYKILIDDEFKPVIQPQRRLNPKVQDVVKNEIVKLLDSRLIYPISNSS
nr:putative reverse transcriptase domain-containing protein [Tanacetum cinerariifolium]